MQLNSYRLVSDIRRIAAQNPDTVYQTIKATPDSSGLCYYFDPHTNEPSCLIGRAMALQGVTRKLIQTHTANVSRFGVFLESTGLLMKREHADWIQTVQNLQDMCHSWGEAVRLADKGE